MKHLNLKFLENVDRAFKNMAILNSKTHNIIQALLPFIFQTSPNTDFKVIVEVSQENVE